MRPGVPGTSPLIFDTSLLDISPDLYNAPITPSGLGMKNRHRIVRAPTSAFQVVHPKPVRCIKSFNDSARPKSSMSLSCESPPSTLYQRKRKRSACITDLKEIGTLNSEGFPNIRVWVDERGRKFYDCICGGRKAVQDLKKIKRHLHRHDGTFKCPVSPCPFVFNYHQDLEDHLRNHGHTQILYS